MATWRIIQSNGTVLIEAFHTKIILLFHSIQTKKHEKMLNEINDNSVK